MVYIVGKCINDVDLLLKDLTGNLYIHSNMSIVGTVQKKS